MVRRDLIELGQFKDYSDLKGLTDRQHASAKPVDALARALDKGGLTYADVNFVPMTFPDIVPLSRTVPSTPRWWRSRLSPRIETLGTAVRWRGNSVIYGNQQFGIVIYGPALSPSARSSGGAG